MFPCELVHIWPSSQLSMKVFKTKIFSPTLKGFGEKKMCVCAHMSLKMMLVDRNFTSGFFLS